jgi:ABC-type amino acid transport substrate-binding protein
MGFPVEAHFLNLPDGMGATRPYADTGFVTASTGAAIPSFGRMVESQKVGVVFLTVASTYFTAQTMAAEHVYYTNDDLYGALLSGEINSALIWQPWLEKELAAHPRRLAVAKLDMPHADWNIVALYPQAGGAGGAVNEFNAGLSALAANGRLGEIVAPYKIPTTQQ